MTFPALKRLGEDFVYNFVNAVGTMEQVEENIKAEMQYQSSIELDTATFDTVSTLPLASHVTNNARQQLVRRLDGYTATEHGAQVFRSVTKTISTQVLPSIEAHAIAGTCTVQMAEPALQSMDHDIRQMVLDILSERGFRVSSTSPTEDTLNLNITWAAPTGLGMKRTK